MAKDKKTNEVTVVIDGKDWKDALDKEFSEKVKTVSIDGFRKGKVPRNIFEKKYGKESLYFGASDKVLSKAFEKALDESKLVPIVQPEVEIKNIDDKKVEFLFKIIERPKLEIKKYKGLNVKEPVVKVTKEEIDHEIGHILDEYTEVVIKEKGKVENGDIVVIDFDGYKDGAAFSGGKAENYELEIGSGTFIPGFEEQLIGMKKDTNKDINVTFPDDYPEDSLKGKEVVFKITLHEIKEKVKRAFDKELFDDLAIDGVDSEEKLRKHVEEEIKEHKKMHAEDEYIEKLLEAVAKNVEVDIPEKMVEEEIDRLVKSHEERMKSQGMSMDLYYAFTKSSLKDLRNTLEKPAYNNVLYRLMLEDIAKLENVEITKEDAMKEAYTLAEKYKMEKDELIKSFGGLEMIMYDLEVRKTIELLKEYNK